MLGTSDRLVTLVEQILGPSMPIPFPLRQELSELGMKSINMVNLMLAVEVEFDIAIPQTDITPENFHSLASVEALVVKLTAPKESAA